MDHVFVHRPQPPGRGGGGGVGLALRADQARRSARALHSSGTWSYHGALPALRRQPVYAKCLHTRLHRSQFAGCPLTLRNSTAFSGQQQLAWLPPRTSCCRAIRKRALPSDHEDKEDGVWQRFVDSFAWAVREVQLRVAGLLALVTEQLGRPRVRRPAKATAALAALAFGFLLLIGPIRSGAIACVETQVLPRLEQGVTHALARKLSLGPVKGLTPWSIHLGETSLGPGREEFTSVRAQNVKLQLLPIASLQRGCLTFGAELNEAHVVARQASNFSWVGVPEATPSMGYPPAPALAPSTSTSGKPFEPPVTVQKVTITDSVLDIVAHHDPIPRRLRHVNGFVRMSRRFDHYYVDVAGRAISRNVGQEVALIRSMDGGDIRVVCDAQPFAERWTTNIQFDNFHTPLAERIVDLPFDVTDGRVSGKLLLSGGKGDTCPAYGGRLWLQGVAFHIDESPSSFTDMDLELLFQGSKMHFIYAAGKYGAVNLTGSGDMDLTPKTGEYRIVGMADPVEVNALMDTFGVLPPPYPVAGHVKGVVQVTGPVEKPKFTGTAAACAESPKSGPQAPISYASQLLGATLGSVLTYDRVPFTSAGAVYTLNTKTDMMLLHSVEANLVGGGTLAGSGTMHVGPKAEKDPNAVNVLIRGRDLATDAILRRYVSPQIELPPDLLGRTLADVSMTGYLLKPTIDVAWQAPNAEGPLNGARGHINITPEALGVTSKASSFDLKGTLHTSFPPLDPAVLRMRGDQARAILLNRRPKIEACDLDVRFNDFDVLPLAMSSPPQLLPDMQAVKLKLSGRATFTGSVPTLDFLTGGSPLAEKRGVPGSPYIAESMALLPVPPTPTKKRLSLNTALQGKLSLSGVKINQLSIAPELSGTLSIAPDRVKLTARGRPDEHLLLDLMDAGEQPIARSAQSRLTGVDPIIGKSGSFSLRKGQMRTDVKHSSRGTQVSLNSLPLNELELGALRGMIEQATVELDYMRQTGDGNITVLRPRFSGLQGTEMQTGFKWSGDTVTVQQVLFQQESQYELTGEYTLPAGATTDQAIWKMRLAVPEAEVAEMLPLVSLLSTSSDNAAQATRSKEVFLEGIRSMGVVGPSLSDQISQTREQIKSEGAILDVLEGGSEDSAKVGATAVLPGLQDLRGKWQGAVEVSGGGGLGDKFVFLVRGRDWEWGSHRLQDLLADGRYTTHSGLELKKFRLDVDEASITMEGNLLGPKQDANFAVMDFPLRFGRQVLASVPQKARQVLPPAMLQQFNTSLDSTAMSAQSLPEVSGALFVKGHLGGSVQSPQCTVDVRVLDGVINAIPLQFAQANATLAPSGVLSFDGQLVPALTQGGHVKFNGNLPLPRDTGILSSYGSAKPAASAISIDASVKDSGMALIGAIAPNVQWQQGGADINMKVRGTLQKPVVDGSAVITRAGIVSDIFPKPLVNVNAAIQLVQNKLRIESLDVKTGHHGRISVKGDLPLFKKDASKGISVNLNRVEVRVKNAYSGHIDSTVTVTGALAKPEVGGKIRLSRGVAFLSANDRPATTEQEATSTGTAAESSGLLVLKNTPRVEEQQPPAVPIVLKDLRLVLGPKMRVMYPFVVNFAAEGQLQLAGALDPVNIRPSGVIRFDSGDVNLVAAQMRLQRDHPNRAIFVPEQGLDPVLDVQLIGSDVRMRIEGRASTWPDHVVLTDLSGSGEALQTSEVARFLESQLQESLLAADGQLAFSSLATSTIKALLPKIETQGQLGQARWRLVSAPSIPNLLSDPISTTDGLQGLSQLSLGTDIEVQFGDRLHASVSRKLQESGLMSTQWSLLYQLNNKCRIKLSGASPLDNTLSVEYSAAPQSSS
eukprot:jgi/Chlat1/1581/Chrsp123S00083